jgi:cytoskeletal protein RodZ
MDASSMSMGSFGDDLRMERLSRGIALEQITEITKVSPRHLLALESNQFRSLPGGILNKGIVRAYVNVVGLDEGDWMTRFQRAYLASGQMLDDDQNWTEFAANVGRARARNHELRLLRLKWMGAAALVMVVACAGFLAIRYFGYRSGWWPSILPLHASIVSLRTWLSSVSTGLADFLADHPAQG